MVVDWLLMLRRGPRRPVGERRGRSKSAGRIEGVTRGTGCARKTIPKTEEDHGDSETQRAWVAVHDRVSLREDDEYSTVARAGTE